MSIDQIKKKLVVSVCFFIVFGVIKLSFVYDVLCLFLQAGNTPKKLEKFNNYLTHTYKVTDPEVRAMIVC